MKHAVFVIRHPYVDAIPCLREPVEFLAKNGWRVDLYTTIDGAYSFPKFSSENVRLIPFNLTKWKTVHFLWRLATHCPQYRCIFAVPQWDLYYAGKVAGLLKIPLICLHDEIFTSKNATEFWRRREKDAHQKACATIELSEERADYVRRENELGPDHKIFVIPNAPAGTSERLKNFYYHEAFDIPRDKILLLHLGSTWSPKIRHLANLAKGWDGPYVLVFQCRAAHCILKDLQAKHVHCNRSVLPNSGLNRAVSSASIGIGLYDTDNIKGGDLMMGYASSKLGVYFRNGLPVIFTDQECFRFIERHGLGICVSDIRQIPAAADKIMARYDFYAKNVKAYFNEKLNFDLYTKPLVELLKSF